MSTVTAFLADKKIASGDRETVAQYLREHHPDSAALVFDDSSGKVTDLDLHGTISPSAPKPVGRPKLGVQSREVTLLPRHWEWLSTQRGGASATLRRLVDEARGQGRSERERQDAAYNFMQALCGDRPGYEEALRALYKGQEEEFSALVSAWPADVTFYISQLLATSGGDDEPA